MENRHNTEIIADLLRTALPGMRLTKLMYGSNLPYRRAKVYLGLLQNNHSIEYDEKNQVYRTTTRGKKFLQRCDELTELLSLKKDKNIARMPNTS
ncbi:MAG: hypothetical protein E6K98_02785 [Thaumarchaeota archaeon]|nr:MAG: hypothetical protein E6K98_02785 [Nitrososphaerota archaeon]TLX95408.1 MAG: hypothetical protein E6K91_02995 [Nitrososphaerota archaeon]